MLRPSMFGTLMISCPKFMKFFKICAEIPSCRTVYVVLSSRISGWGQKIDVGVGCWRHNMLVTSLRLTFWSPRSSIPSSLSGSSISQVSSISKFCHRHPKIVTNTKMSPKLLWCNNPKYETEPIYTNIVILRYSRGGLRYDSVDRYS